MIEEMMYNNQIQQQANQKEAIELPELNKLGQGSAINDSEVLATPQFALSDVTKPFRSWISHRMSKRKRQLVKTKIC